MLGSPPLKNRLPVTVVVPVKNEEKNLQMCLDRLARFSEIVVIDSGSSDRTVEIAKSFGARVVDFAWNGRYPKKRNWFLLNETVSTPWVLFLDADEYISDDFCNEVSIAVAQEDVDGYWLHYENHFLGRPLRHGLVQRKLALFRVGKALYEQIEERNWSTLDMEIHEHPIVDGRVGNISARIDHCDFKGLAHFIDKHRDYAQWEAHRYELLRNAPPIKRSFTLRQKFKYANVAKWWYPLLYFVVTFIAKRGFLDGVAGFHYAVYKMWYVYTIRLLISEHQSLREHPQQQMDRKFNS